MAKFNYSTLSQDLPAAIAVYLVAIPLSLGIALASGAPLFSGLITCIISGLIVVPLSGSALGISGPAAGLAIIVAAAIQDLGFNAFLMAVILAGLMQIAMGMLKAGVIAYYFPSSVINGMLSGIGIILILKQLPHAFGYDRDYEGDDSFFQSDNYSSFSELFHMLDFVSPAAIVIALVSLAVLIIWELPVVKKYSFFHLFQGSLAAILAGVALNRMFMAFSPGLALSQAHLVNMPVFAHKLDILTQLDAPDYTQWANPGIYFTALTLAVVGSVETLLAVEAVDKLDPYKRVTPTNRELVAQGIGNISCGMIGGLPLTQVVIRSSINIAAGAQTRAAGFLHGILLLFSVVFIPALFNWIPLASLASVLIVVGYKLARPQIFKTMFEAGWYHFVPFCITILGLVLTNLPTGIMIGLTAALIAILLENFKSSFYFFKSKVGNKIILRLSEQVSFLNKANIHQTLEAIDPGSEVVIDASRSKYIDYDIYEILQDFRIEANLKNITLTIENLRGYGTLPPLEVARPPTYDAQQALTPAMILSLLKEGNERFVNNLESNRNLLEQVNDTRSGQFPIAIVLSCIDSRTSAELIFDLGLGDIFSARIAGNIVNDDILGSMEFACKLAGSKLIVVLGHSHCGAIKGACADVKLDHLTVLLEKIKPAVDSVRAQEASEVLADNSVLVQKVAEHNVRLTVALIRQQSALLAEMAAVGEIGIVGAMYDIETGKVEFYDD